MNMKNLIQKWNNISLIKRIICGLIIGIALGLIFPQATAISILGDLFVGALRGIAPLLVFFLIMSSLCRMQKARKRTMSFIVILYLLGNLFSALSAVIASYLFPVTLTFSQSTNTQDINTTDRCHRSAEKSADECRCESSRLTGKRQLYRNPCMGHHTWHCS